MKRSILCAWCLFVSYLAPGQLSTTFTLNGEVVDHIKNKVAAGDAFLLNPADSSVVKSTFINNGKFTLATIVKGTYILRISSVERMPVFQSITMNRDTAVTIVLPEKSITLKEVTVSGAQRIFTIRDGNINMAIENTILSEVPSTIDLLAKLPGIQVSGDRQTINVVGKSDALLYIGNQRASINDINSLTVKDIKSIEIINNPSAKYEAEGRVVILITKKVSKREGYRVDISQTFSFKRRYNNYARINMSFKKKKVEWKANAEYNQLKVWESNSYDFNINNGALRSGYSILSVEKSPQITIGTGFFYQINTEDYFSLTANTRRNVTTYPNVATTTFFDGSSNTEVGTVTDNKKRRFYSSATANYSKRLQKSKALIFAGAQYSDFVDNLYTDVYNDFNNTGSVYGLISDQQYRVHAFSGRMDYEKSLKENIKLESGLSYATAKARALSLVDDLIAPVRTNSKYNYKENTYAAFAQLSGHTPKLGYSLGLRFEQNNVQGGFENKPLLVTRNNSYLFPRLSLDITLDSNKNLTFNYARSIKRPNFSNLTQISVYLNPFTVFSRNINLQPALIDDISINLRVKDKFIRLFYYSLRNTPYLSTQYNSSQKLLTIIDKNYEREYGFNLNLTVPVRYKTWNSTNVLIGNIGYIRDADAILNTSKPSLYGYSGNQFSLKNDYKILLSAWFVTKRFTGLYERAPLSAVDIGFSKTFFKSLNCTLNFNDIFRTLNSRQQFINGSVFTDGRYFEDIREISVNIRYFFGEFSKSAYRNRNVDDNADRYR
ncbi:MAG: TonB-dependent receptor [Bacteroidetes bacterium]|nr:TonB-dependent receptor [Bacteroidota bacterium]